MRGLRLLVSWLLALFLIFVFLQVTVHPLPDPPKGWVLLFDRPGENILFQTMADRTGLFWLEPTGRVIVAGLQLLTCLFLFFPQSRRFGAVLAFLILAGAVAVHLSPDILGREVPASLAPGTNETDGGRLFMLAIATLAMAMLLIFVHPGKKRHPFR
ncbi:hypothetical protein [Henriciella aquimarina]|uniref:hypothetical protein n=1 Tax=Henriciella aquimarina TaxID=545261 RepID=UPI000A04D7F0|nr:hypothetical protein [Henriciella aquimarina]